MFDTELRFYLKTNLKKPTIDFKWTDKDNANLFSYIGTHCQQDCLQNPKNQLKIKKAFKDYFQDIGYILFKMNENQIRLKVFPYKIEPKDSMNLSSVINIIDSNEDLIEFEYKGKKNQASFPKELKDKLFHFVNNITNEEINKKELVRFAIGKYFDLDESDIVLIRADQIFIKIFDKKHKHEVAEDEKDTIANRYNGINEEELVSFYDEFFSKEENKDFFQLVARTYVEIYLLEEKIDNYTYEKNVFSDIQSIVIDELINMFEHNDDFLKGFSGYIFRLHFREVFEYIANLILEQVAILNSNITDFLKYYTTSIIVQNGKRYKVPNLETEDGLKWNVVSMLSVVKIYTKTKASLDEINQEISELNAKLEPLYINNVSPLDYQMIIIKEKDKLTRSIAEDEKKLLYTTEALESSQSENRALTLKNDIRQLKEKIAKNRDERTKITSRMVKKSIIIKYNALRKELDDMVRQVHRKEKLLSQNEESYLSIKNALVKALISKKKLIG